MNQTRTLLVFSFLIGLTGCSTLNSWWENDDQVKQLPNKCDVTLISRKTYLSRFEANAIYLYDKAGNSCLLKVINTNRSKSTS